MSSLPPALSREHLLGGKTQFRTFYLTGKPRHPSPVLLLETDDRIERIVLPADAWSRLREVLKVGRRVRVAGTQDLMSKPGVLPAAISVELVDVH